MQFYAVVRLPVFQGILFRVINHIEGEIDIEFRPVHMVSTESLNVRDLLHRGFCKLRKRIERHVMLSSVNIEPEAPGVDVGYLKYRCAVAKRL